MRPLTAGVAAHLVTHAAVTSDRTRQPASSRLFPTHMPSTPHTRAILPTTIGLLALLALDAPAVRAQAAQGAAADSGRPAPTAAAQTTPMATPSDTTVHRENRGMDWGWLGLLGLAGLAGLRRPPTVVRRETVVDPTTPRR